MANTVNSTPDAAPQRGTTANTANPTSGGEVAAAAVREAEHLAVSVPFLGDLQLPRPEQLAYYAGVGALVALGILEWPAALVLGAGHVLLTQQHNRSIQEFGAALEDG